MALSDLCTICLQSLMNNVDSVTKVGKRGLETLISQSKKLNDNRWQDWDGKENVTFHTNCRKKYAVARKPLTLSVPPTQFISSSSCIHNDRQHVATRENQFNFKELCFFCASSIFNRNLEIRSVQQEHFKTRILNHCQTHMHDTSTIIFDRLKDIKSMVEVKARYHKKCYNDFFYVPSGKRSGSYTIDDLESAFDAVCDYVESNEQCQLQLSDLKAVMRDYQMSNKTLFRKLKEKYNNDIDIIQQVGKQPIISYKTSNIFRSCIRWNESVNISSLEKDKILETAAKIIQSDIKSQNYDIEYYPSSEKFLDNIIEVIPQSLTTFLNNLITSENRNNQESIIMKRDSIAHAIISGVRSRSFISSLQLALGIYINRKSGSKLIIDMLSKLGLCSSYYDIQLYEASVIMDPPHIELDNIFVQHVYDNTDHNVKTLDGHEPFHCLGGIAVYTPGYGVSHLGKVKKLKRMPPASALASVNTIDIVPHMTGNIINGLEEITFVDIKSLKLADSLSLPYSYSTYLWVHSAKWTGSNKLPKIPSWKGFMEVLANDSYSYETSKIKCMPFINQPPSNMTTLNTALHNSNKECNLLKQKFSFVTFDQPLYLKARAIVAACEDKSLKNVIVRLGGFHLLMSYMGSIGHVMDGSGLEDLWEVVYTSGSVKQMLTGHAYARSLRAHILTFTALGIILCQNVNSDSVKEHNKFLEQFFKKWNSEPPSIGDCNYEEAIKKMTNDLLMSLNSFKDMGPTSKLWVQYFECVTVALQFIEAERLGDWKLHLQSIQKMLPIFHASGHHAYAKSAQIYLQDMVQLEYVMDDTEYHRFTKEGFFTIRRSDKAFCGVWADMTIEQTLNRFFGTDLKHGRGVTPSVVARYLDSMPSVFDIMESLEEYIGITSASSEQHVDLSAGRIKRDTVDLSKFVFWLREHGPFKKRDYLMSLSTGVIGEADINCHNAKELGYQGMMTMVNKRASKVSLSFTYRVKSLANAKTVNKSPQSGVFTINAALLFQKLTSVFQKNPEVKRQAFDYELSPYPLSLFDKNGAMRKTKKSELYDSIPSLDSNCINLSSLTFVIDGGFLLHKVIWPHGKSYRYICELYLTYIRAHYHENSYIIFDGYDNEYIGVKSYERFRRQQKSIGADIDFSEDMIVQIRQSSFLANIINKQRFVAMLANYLLRAGMNVTIAPEDADFSIVKTAIDLNTADKSVAVVGTDIDLLVLLIGLTPIDHEIYFRKCNNARTPDTWYTTRNNISIKPFILFAHAFAGCDTTNAMYGKGKKMLLKLLKQNSELQHEIMPYYNINSTTEDLYPVAEKIIFNLYGANGDISGLGELRCKRFDNSGCVETSDMKLSQLPPTKGALIQHIKRVFYQVQSWLGNKLRPEQWGWRQKIMMMTPIMTEDEPAPDSLLSLIACGCKTDCSTSRCSCRKAGLHCTQLCKHCNGECCTNVNTNKKNHVDAINEVDELDEDSDIDDSAETSRYQTYHSPLSDSSDEDNFDITVEELT